MLTGNRPDRLRRQIAARMPREKGGDSLGKNSKRETAAGGLTGFRQKESGPRLPRRTLGIGRDDLPPEPKALSVPATIIREPNRLPASSRGLNPEVGS